MKATKATETSHRIYRLSFLEVRPQNNDQIPELIMDRSLGYDTTKAPSWRHALHTEA
ncbi:MAG: hypothetical protein NT069_30685 [Planctomycetota bacterium]|nr:hypothetical protein [Planctomycetota bacterium]